MIRFHSLFLGVIGSGVVMIRIYLGLWLYEAGGTKGMRNDDPKNRNEIEQKETKEAKVQSLVSERVIHSMSPFG